MLQAVSPGTVLEWAAYLITSLLVMWPAPLHLASRFVGHQDAHYYLWATWKVGDALRHWQLGWHIPGVFWPYGTDIRLLDGQLPTFIGGLWQLVTSPFLAFNLTLITATLLNIWAARRIARLYSDDRLVWALSAIAFATAPAIAARMVVHLTMYFAFAVALLVEEALRVARGDHPVRPVRLAVLVAVAYLCGIYYLVFGVLAYGLIVLTSSTRRDRLWRTAVRTLAGGLLAAAVLSPFIWARVSLDRNERAHGHNPVLLQYTFDSEADALSIVAQPPTSTVDLPGEDVIRRHFRESNVPEATIFPGFLLLCGISGLVLLKLPMRRPVLLTSATLWLLSLGTSLKINGHFPFTSGDGTPVAWMPYTWFFSLPGLASLRSPNRVSYTLAAVLVAPLAMSLNWLFGRWTVPWKRWALAGGAAALLATSLMVPVPTSTLEASPALANELRQVAERAQPGQSMAQIPADCTFGTLFWSIDLQILYRAPAVGCQASPSAVPWTSGLSIYHRSAALAAIRCDPRKLGLYGATRFRHANAFQLSDVGTLRSQLGVRFYLVDREAIATDRCNAGRARLNSALRLLRTHFHVMGTDSRWVLIDTEHPNGASV